MGSVHDAGASSFLYPFLGEGERDLEAVLADVRLGPDEGRGVGALRVDAHGRRARSGRRRRRCERSFARAGSCSRSATAARPPTQWTWSLTCAGPRAAGRRLPLDLAEDPAILTALANDIGPEALFPRQVIAYGREGDARSRCRRAAARRT